MRYLLSFFVVVLFLACGQSGAKKEHEKKEVVIKFTPITTAPFHLTDEAKIEYIKEHYWDKFDFADTVLLKKIDSSSVFGAYYGYVMNFVTPDEPAPLLDLLKRASTSKLMFSYFMSMSERLFSDPNSQMRNDDMYIAILNTKIESPLFDQWEKIAFQEDLKMAKQNRVGHKANDFRYTLASGKTGMLSGLKAEFTLIYIHNPDCAMCNDITRELMQSPIINEMLKSNRLKILAIYTEEDIALWQKRNDHIPVQWINGYDKGCIILNEGSYDLNAVPAMYLLDSEKRVLLKDTVSVPHIEHVISQGV